MTEEVDILSELIADDKIIPEGEYTATIMSIDSRVTIYKGYPYWAMKLKVGKKTTWTNIYAGPIFLNHLMERFKDQLIGTEVKIVMRHRVHNDHTYHDAKFKAFS